MTLAAEQNGDFAAALEGFTALGEYRDSAARAAALQQKGSYARAQQAIADNDLALAYECFVACGDYQDSAAKASVLSITAIAETTVINENLAAYSFNGMCGLIHLNSNTITNPAWEDIGRINEHGLIPVYNDGIANRAIREYPIDRMSEIQTFVIFQSQVGTWILAVQV